MIARDVRVLVDCKNILDEGPLWEVAVQRPLDRVKSDAAASTAMRVRIARILDRKPQAA